MKMLLREQERVGRKRATDRQSACVRGRDATKGHRVSVESCGPLQLLPLCSQEQESETDPQQGGGLLHPSSCLASSSPLLTPLSPASRHLSPPFWFVSPPYILFSFLSFFIMFCLPLLCHHPSLRPCISKTESQMDKLTMAPPPGLASGPSRTGNMPGILRCLAYFHMTPRKLE